MRNLDVGKNAVRECVRRHAHDCYWRMGMQMVGTAQGRLCPPYEIVAGGASAATAGIARSKTEPPESDLTSRNLPPWFSTSEAQIARPNPMPPALVVNSGSKMLSRSCSAIPGPESSTDSDTVARPS